MERTSLRNNSKKSKDQNILLEENDEFEVKEYSKLLSKLMNEQKNKSVDMSTRSSIKFGKPDVRTYLKNSVDYFEVKPQQT